MLVAPATLDEVLDDVDAVVHLAARPSVPRSIDDPVASHVANATGIPAFVSAALEERPVPDQTRLRELFPGIEPVGFDEGLRATIDWFRTGEVAVGPVS